MHTKCNLFTMRETNRLRVLACHRVVSVILVRVYDADTAANVSFHRRLFNSRGASGNRTTGLNASFSGCTEDAYV